MIHSIGERIQFLTASTGVYNKSFSWEVWSTFRDQLIATAWWVLSLQLELRMLILSWQLDGWKLSVGIHSIQHGFQLSRPETINKTLHLIPSYCDLPYQPVRTSALYQSSFTVRIIQSVLDRKKHHGMSFENIKAMQSNLSPKRFFMRYFGLQKKRKTGKSQIQVNLGILIRLA